MITTFRKLDLFPSSGKKEDAAIYMGPIDMYILISALI